MEPLHAVVLALLQGLTEFLPISSSAHLVLLPMLVEWPDQGLAFDVAVHVGTLIAVLAYFRAEVAALTRDGIASLGARRAIGRGRLAGLIVVATIPTGLAGLAMNTLGGDGVRSALVIAIANLLFAAALWLADARGAKRRDVSALTATGALVIGAAQALALVPGTSRAGVTITAALALGLTRSAAARFSFLLAIPVIALAGGLKAYQAVTAQVSVDWMAIGVGVALSLASALACIHAFLALVERIGMLPFVLYRLALGGALLAFVV